MARSASAAPPPTAYQRALRRLARRDQSAAELRRALLARGHGAEEVDAALDRLREERYVDDAGFAERFARSRMAHQGVGRLRIRQGLRQRGVDRGATEAGLAGATREVDEREVLDGLARRYWRGHAGVEPAQTRIQSSPKPMARPRPPWVAAVRTAQQQRSGTTRRGCTWYVKERVINNWGCGVGAS